MEIKQYTVGEISAATGLTVRALQHYDNINLLPVSDRTEGGRRFYTQNDLFKLEQIIFYKSIGIPLKIIKDKLNDTQSLSDLELVLSNHRRALLQKIDALNLSMSLPDSSLEVIQAGKYPPWDLFVFSLILKRKHEIKIVRFMVALLCYSGAVFKSTTLSEDTI